VEEYEEQEEAGGAPLNKKQRKAVIKDSGKKEVGFGEEKSTFHGAPFVVLVWTCARC
jgi:pre-mRNA-processing factor 17